MYLEPSSSVLALNLMQYLRLPSTHQAVILPAVLAILFWQYAKKHSLPIVSGVLFLLGTMATVQFSYFFDDGNEANLYQLPGYLTVLVLVPTRYRPHWGHAYALSFISMFCSDLFCAFKHFQGQSGFTLNFFCGVGGAGFSDALVSVPLVTLVFVFAGQYLETHKLSNMTVSEFRRHLFARPASANSAD
jgi:hypothetical protein